MTCSRILFDENLKKSESKSAQNGVIGSSLVLYFAQVFPLSKLLDQTAGVCNAFLIWNSTMIQTAQFGIRLLRDSLFYPLSSGSR